MVGLHRIRCVIVSLLALLATATGCRGKRQAETHAGPAAASQVVVAARTAASSRAVAPGASSAPTQQASASASGSGAVALRPPAATLPCKAARVGQPVSLGTRTDQVVAIQAWGNQIYLLSHQQVNARTTLSSFPRDGGTSQQVGRYEGLGEPQSFRVTRDGAYFTQRRALLRIPLGGGAPETVAADFAAVATVAGRHAYGIRCGSPQLQDQVLRISAAGGVAEPIAAIQRETKTCRYGDVAIAEGTVFATDWEGRRVLAVDLSSGKVTVLTSGHPFAASLFVSARYVDFSASDGLRRVPRAGGKAEKLATMGTSPWDAVAFDGADFWIYDAAPYEQEHVWRLAGGGGDPDRIYSFHVQDVLGSGAVGMTVDDQCFYYTQRSPAGDFATLFAQKKPPHDAAAR